ncbi:MAG: 50S ribosomal protein L35 [Gemmatimonadota bacterium]|nr:50S ribosomal protein L35 [Gemmatimonadota bacterium]
MPKMKTNRSAAKRFKRTANGKFKRYKAGKTHNTGKKSAKRKRHLRKPSTVSNADHQRVKRLLAGG